MCQLICKPHDSRNLGLHDRSGAVFVLQRIVVRSKSWTRQPVNDAWDATNWDGLGGTPWQMEENSFG